jgi:hypothetical protein
MMILLQLRRSSLIARAFLFLLTLVSSALAGDTTTGTLRIGVILVETVHVNANAELIISPWVTTSGMTIESKRVDQPTRIDHRVLKPSELDAESIATKPSNDSFENSSVLESHTFVAE